MTIVIATAGTRGDVAPYTGLGDRLRAAGHKVAIATHARFADLVTGAGFEFREIPGDPRELFESKAFQRWANGGSSVRKLVSWPPRPPKRNVFAELVEGMRGVADGVLAAVGDDTDLLLLSNSVSAFGHHAAEATGVPSMGVYWGPVLPTAAFPPIMAGIRTMGPAVNRALGALLDSATDPLYSRAVRDLRAGAGLPATGHRAVRLKHERQRWPIYCGFSPSVVPRPADWRDGVEVVGYWWPYADQGWEPSPRLVDFLDSGPPPVFVGFGSHASGEGERLAGIAGKALRAAGVRGVVQAGWADLSTLDGDDLLSIGEVPYEWLFPRMAAVVHHAGVGTTAAGIRAGVPAVPVPVWLDQPFWAGRLAALGVSPAPIPLTGLTAPRLADAVRAAVSDPSYGRRATELARRVAQEDGAASVVTAVEAMLEVNRGG
ncbi:MAG TPA: glycosyltransferase [Amycolatopsis sp.]|uniref:glycosyltransferase n=1 Tax=Amycolatopsis sp. TaxID=37632 RepID=UPI002B49E34B|nr:glycosyltransferase [Amycolatopsis sp.]HKS50126.1 glycosyltransferase [Amycolatopsis sp.]